MGLPTESNLQTEQKPALANVASVAPNKAEGQGVLAQLAADKAAGMSQTQILERLRDRAGLDPLPPAQRKQLIKNTGKGVTDLMGQYGFSGYPDQLLKKGNLNIQQRVELANAMRKNLVAKKAVSSSDILSTDQIVDKYAEIHGIARKEAKKKELMPLIDKLNPELPENFRNEAEQTAEYIAALDSGQPLIDPNLRKFVEQLASTGFIQDVFYREKYGRIDAKKSLPSWLQPDFLATEGIKVNTKLVTSQEIQAVKDTVTNYAVNHKFAASKGHNGDYVDFPELQKPVTSMSKQFKVYIEPDDIEATQKGFGSTLDKLIAEQISPRSMKNYVDTGKIILYFNNLPVDSFSKIDTYFKQVGITPRGPAQDVIRLSLDKAGELKKEQWESNDSSLGVPLRVDPKDRVQWLYPNYDSGTFLAKYLQLCYDAGKNPSNPYLTSFLHLDIDDTYKSINPVELNKFVSAASVKEEYPVFYTQQDRRAALFKPHR